MAIQATSVGHQMPPPSPAAIRFAQTRDIDEQAALLRGWNQTYAQTSAGSFVGSILEVELDGIHLFAEETSNALYQMGELPANLCAVGLPLRISGRSTFCGSPCDGSSLHIFSGDGGFEFMTPGGLVMAGFVVDIAVLAEALAEPDRAQALRGLDRAHLRRTTADCAFGLRKILSGAFELFRSSPELASDRDVAASFRRSLISALGCALTCDGDESQLNVAPTRRWQIVRQARDLSVGDLDHPMTVAELCVALGVSRRMLQYCFHDVLGIGPAEFLRAVRLSGARRALKTSTSVTQAASLWGFLHFGRFAQDYREMFGERPSETFRRYHRNEA